MAVTILSRLLTGMKFILYYVARIQHDRANISRLTLRSTQEQISKLSDKGFFVDAFYQPVPAEQGTTALSLAPVDGAELQAVLQAHLHWTESGGTEGARAVLRDCDLSYFDLRGVVLAGANLKGSDLTGCCLADADLHGADLSGVVLMHADMQRAILFGAQMQEAKLQGANLSASELSSANFVSAQMQEANLTDAAMDGCNLRDANLTRAVLRKANLTGANLKGAHLENASFADANLSNTDLRGAFCKHTAFDRAVLSKTQFKDALLEGVDFTQTDFLQAGEINEEYRQLSLQAERWRLDQEKARLLQAHKELEAEHQKFLQKKLVVADWRRGENDYVVQTAIHAVWMKYLAISWGGVAALFVGVTLYQASQIPLENLRIRELMLVLSIIGGVTALFGVTAYRVRKLGRMMSHYDGFFRQKLASLVAIHSGVPTIDQSSLSAQPLGKVQPFSVTGAPAVSARGMLPNA